ncbi:protein FAM3C-like isoform X2 [Xyrichtys novacula]|uniref:Protein FAM3C-like isoform X2 n=1 Tax=Xyrichtys novacula TaxID=13765 RepID=A0AAV1F522_XYRNO|nr:protein FAM3C-like isoform X2 [Xyrichtys novacula]
MLNRRYFFSPRFLLSLLVLVPAGLGLAHLLLKLAVSSGGSLYEDSGTPKGFIKNPAKRQAESCPQKTCPDDYFSFYMQTGAANVVPPKICVQNHLVLGFKLLNAGVGINIIVLNGVTGEVSQTGQFNMYNGAVKPLIEFLENIKNGSIVLMASYDDPATQLDDTARKLIADLGSSSVQSLGFRDSWGFVGAKGAVKKSNFEKHLKNDGNTNMYDSWPEVISLEGCLPKFLEGPAGSS